MAPPAVAGAEAAAGAEAVAEAAAGAAAGAAAATLARPPRARPDPETSERADWPATLRQNRTQVIAEAGRAQVISEAGQSTCRI